VDIRILAAPGTQPVVVFSRSLWAKYASHFWKIVYQAWGHVAGWTRKK
jgi:hypothetical protein